MPQSSADGSPLVPNSAILDARNVSFHRGGQAILRGVRWRIAPGEHWALLGANGSGKTTLLKIVTGCVWASEGEVTVLGRPLGHCDIRQLRRDIGWVSTAVHDRIGPRDAALDVVVTGIDAALGIYRNYSDGEIVLAREALERIGAGAVAEREWAALSQGERQRVAIARALVYRPKLVILDEPCAGLDPAARERFLTDIERLCALSSAPSVVLVTHHIEEIGPWITHALALKDGAVLASGAVSEVVTAPVMQAAFGRPCRIDRPDGRYRLQLM